MKSSTTTHVSEPRQRMLEAMFQSIDDGDVDALVSYLHPDATQSFANQEPLVGHVAIREGNRAFLSSIRSLSHQIVDAWESADTVVIRLQVTYERHDGATVTIPVVTLFQERDGLIDVYEVFFDVTPVFA